MNTLYSRKFQLEYIFLLGNEYLHDEGNRSDDNAVNLDQNA